MIALDDRSRKWENRPDGSSAQMIVDGSVSSTTGLR
jgi:hypothetical protein